MPNDIVKETLENATKQAWDCWAARHPNLARVIDDIEIRQQTVQRLRETEDYRAAIAEYHQACNESDLFNRLLDLAGSIIKTLLS